MKSSTFNLIVAVMCAGFAAFGNPELWAVCMNVAFAIVNLTIGLIMYNRGE